MSSKSSITMAVGNNERYLPFDLMLVTIVYLFFVVVFVMAVSNSDIQGDMKGQVKCRDIFHHMIRHYQASGVIS